MQIGIHFIDFLLGDPRRLGPTLAATASAAEHAGVEMFTLADHFLQMEGVGRAQDPSWRATPRWASWRGRPERSR